MTGEEIAMLFKEGLQGLPTEVYTNVILPNAKYIVPSCIIIGLYFSYNLVRKWINKIP